MPHTDKMQSIVMNSNSFEGQMITTYECADALVNGIVIFQFLTQHSAHKGSVMVWEAIAYDIWSTLTVACRALAGQCDVNDILRSHMGPFLNGDPRTTAQQYHARSHPTRVAQELIRHVPTIPWSGRSSTCPLQSM